MSSLLRYCLAALLAALLSQCPSDRRLHAAEPPRFARDVQPILATKCFRCHGPDEAARQSGLRLDQRSAATGPADSGAPAIVPGQPEVSELIRRIQTDDPSSVMPPPEAKQALSDAEKATLVAWVEQGAPYERHWSWEPITRPPLPALDGAAWSRHPIDTFVLARLQREGLTPSPRAGRDRLLRRLSLDLTGLPPSAEQVAAFRDDRAADAVTRLVDRLLASPAFGERMAWDWLDAARYADSNGYQGDAERTMWPWRDWAVSAWNQGLPFDQFTVWQLAGDQLADATFEQRLATGFCRNHMINGEGGRIAEENRVEYVMDMTETMGTVWLGLTLNCCRCHDHKYDALSQRDYYSLFAFFNQTPVDGGGGNPQTPPVLEVASREQQEQRQTFEQQLEQLASQIGTHESQLPAAGTHADPLPTGDEVLQLLKTSLPQRDSEQLGKLAEHFAASHSNYAALLKDYRSTREARDRLQASLPRVMVMRDQEELRPTHLLEKGLYNRPGEQVQAAVPASLPNLGSQPARRLELAQWLVHPANPLTARVTVNRIWQQFFGVGLVKTSEDFGTQGELPSHPELLDWLAAELIDSGWDVKHLCRLIVTSETYLQSSDVTPEAYERDPENRLLARASRYRLPSWMIRDQALALSGLLVRELGGPPVYPYQPSGVWEDATFGNKSYQTDGGAKLYRRSIYTFWRRIVGPTTFFDSASRQTCVVKQSRTNTPLHALTTWNDTTYVEAARVLAERLLTRLPGEASHAERAAVLFEHVLCRTPTPPETAILAARLERLEQQFAAAPDECDSFLSSGQYPRQQQLDPVHVAAMAALAGAVLNLDETISRE